MAEEDGLRRGLTVEEARRAARVQLGGITQLRESWRAAWGLPWLDGFALDARLGLRMLRRSWGLTLAGGLAMTIVITIAAVVFVFLDEFMGRTAPPLDEGERVVALQSWDVEAHRRRDTSRRDLERWGATLQSVEDLGGFQTIERRLMVESRPAEWVRVAEITASGFRLARVPPLLGRWIAEADEHVAAAPVVVIGHDVWRSRFASDPAVIGQTVRLGEVFHTVVGVMPEGFAFPVNHRYWIPLRSDPSGWLKHAPEGVVFARLAAGVSLDGAQAELTAIGLLPPATGPASGTRQRDTTNDRRRAPPTRRALYVCVYRRCRARGASVAAADHPVSRHPAPRATMPEHRHPHLRTNGHAPGGVRRALRARREPRSHRGAVVRGGARALLGGGSHGARPHTPDPHPDRRDHQALPAAGRLAPVLGGLRLLVARRPLRRLPQRAGRADRRPGTCAAGHWPGPAHRTPLVG